MVKLALPEERVRACVLNPAPDKVTVPVGTVEGPVTLTEIPKVDDLGMVSAEGVIVNVGCAPLMDRLTVPLVRR